MNVLVVYCHPSSNSFTHAVKEAFVKGLLEAGHTCILSDLYAMGFDAVFSEREYLREAFYDESKEVPADILIEQEKIQRSDAIAFIYPNFWTEAPALLTGWFQRVWTYGYAYGGAEKMKQLDKALFLVTMGGCLKEEIRKRQVEAMKTVMLGDRMNGRARAAEMVVFDEMARSEGNHGRREEKALGFLEQVCRLGVEI